jgi:hypothetical protein
MPVLLFTTSLKKNRGHRGHDRMVFGFPTFNATFNNISVISWWSGLLVEETGVPGENHRHVASH